jgi:hypothetical protein
MEDNSTLTTDFLKAINEKLAKDFEMIFSSEYHGDTYYDNALEKQYERDLAECTDKIRQYDEQDLKAWADKVHPLKEPESVETKDSNGLPLLIFGATVLGAFISSIPTKSAQVRIGDIQSSINEIETVKEMTL